MTMHEFTCDRCGEQKRHESDFTTGYATNREDEKICFACCALADSAEMVKTGSSRSLPLYLTKAPDGTYRVGNWPGTLTFPVTSLVQGGHNMARTRYDVRFTGPEGSAWYGTQYGDMTEIVHCKRSKGQ